MNWVGVALLGLAGFLLGGTVSFWRSSRVLAALLGLATALAIAGGLAWLM